MSSNVSISIDIEPTNRCNADCSFCPRDQTPHQGLMAPETFAAALARAVELREVVEANLDGTVRVSLCGLGEPLLNRHTPDFVAAVRGRGFECSMSSNAALLDERRGRAVLDAGLQQVDINVGEVGEDYERIYRLPFDKTRDNIVRFVEMAEGRCTVQIILVDHRGDPDHLAEVEAYWRGLGLDDFFSFQLINRGGALEVDHSQVERIPEQAQATALLAERGAPTPVCVWPFQSMVVGYDGHYYLCCSDWRKQVSLGTVHDLGFVDLLRAKLEHTVGRSALCRSCNLDPVNRLTDQLRTVGGQEPDPVAISLVAADVVQGDERMRALAEGLAPGVTAGLEGPVTPSGEGRRRIPVRVL